MSRRTLSAWIISLAGHGLLVFAIVQLCAVIGNSPDSQRPAVNRIIDAPQSYATISVTFADEKAEPIQAPPPLVEPRMPDRKQPENRPSDEDRAKSTEHVPYRQDILQAGHQQTGAAPLHGKISRPGTSIVYVLDQSGSMARDGKIRRAISMLRASLAQLGPDVRFQVVVYDSRPTVFRIGRSSDLVHATADNIAAAMKHLDEIVGEGSSRHYDGLMTGLGLHPDVLIMLTDSDELTPLEVKRLKEWNRKPTMIHAVLFGHRAANDRSALSELAGADRVHYVR